MDTELARQAADPATPQEVLADLAYRHPELRPLVAANPATYEGLREWLRALGDPAVDRVLGDSVLEDRVLQDRAQGDRAQGNPADHRRFRWPWAIVGAAGVVALVLVAVILWPRAIENQSVTAPLAGTMPAPTSTPLAEAVPARDGSYPGVSTSSLVRLPIGSRTVTADYGPENSVQRFADDVAAGNVDRLVEKCWTYAPETVRDRYGTDQARGAILDAFAHPSRYTQGGAIWEGGAITVDVRNEELIHELAVRKVVGEYVRDYYVLTRLDASSTASLVLQKAGPRVCVGDGSTP